MQHVSKWSQTQISVAVDAMQEIVDAETVPVPLERMAGWWLFMERATPALLTATEVDSYDA